MYHIFQGILHVLQSVQNKSNTLLSWKNASFGGLGHFLMTWHKEVHWVLCDKGERGGLQIFCKNSGPLLTQCGAICLFCKHFVTTAAALGWADTKSQTVTILDNKQNLKIFSFPAPRFGRGELAILHRNPNQWLDCPADNIVRKLTLIDSKTSYFGS